MSSSLPLRRPRIPITFNLVHKAARHVLVLPHTLWLVAFASCVSVLHADPPSGTDWIPIPELTDEFEGDSLDSAKWHDHNPGWKGRKPGLFSRNNVEIKDGQLHLTARAENVDNAPEGYHSFTTAAVKSKALVRYGYFEIKCRPMNSVASSAFWFYHNTPEEWTEIDVFEIGGAASGHEHTYHMNAHVFHSPAYKGTVKKHLSFPGQWQPSYRLADEQHVYALEWNKEVIRWYVDDRVVRELKNSHWHQPLHLNFDTETMPEWFGLPKKKELPARFSIEYVRAWRR